ADQVLQGEDHVRGRDDRVPGHVRVGGMPATATNGDGDLVVGRVHGARPDTDLAAGDVRVHVNADHGADVLNFELRGTDQILGSARLALLPRLQYRDQRQRPTGGAHGPARSSEG